MKKFYFFCGETLLLLLFHVILEEVQGFLVASPPSVVPSSLHSSPLDLELEELDRARATFEKHFWQEHNEKEYASSSSPILTSAGRHRRNLEILLLESLRDSDDAVDELMHLWMYERDAQSADDLVKMQELCSPGLVQEEIALREMVGKDATWAEPYSRLAAILYFKGQTENSYEIAERTLRMKPWHFEVSQLLIMLSLRQQNMSQAMYWARNFALPPLRENTGNKKRNEWVDRALQQARNQYEEAEKATEAKRKSRSKVVVGEGNTWQ